MTSNVYRINDPVTVAIQLETHYELVQLPVGSLFRAADSKPDRNGMIQGTCRGDAVLMFMRDLEDCASPIAGETISFMTSHA